MGNYIASFEKSYVKIWAKSNKNCNQTINRRANMFWAESGF